MDFYLRQFEFRSGETNSNIMEKKVDDRERRGGEKTMEANGHRCHYMTFSFFEYSVQIFINFYYRLYIYIYIVEFMFGVEVICLEKICNV